MGEPITGICIVDKRSNCPPQYTVISKTLENDDADLWKDGMFRSKITRYICFTKNITVNQWNHIATNIILIGIRDPVPQGYTALRETIDTKESAFKKHVLCVQYTPKPSTDTAITDLMITRTNTFKAQQYTSVGELNGFNFCFKLTNVPRIANRPAPPAPAQIQNLIPVQSSPPPIPQRPHLRDSTRRKEIEPMAGIAGVPFKLHDRFLQSNSAQSSQDDLHITIRTKTELDECFSYDFSKERQIIVR